MAQIVKRCPQCGWELKERTNSENGSTFLGCTKFPECRYTEPVPEHIRLQRQGATPLPGMEW